MKIVELEFSYIVKEIFPPFILAGFTKNLESSFLEKTLAKALGFLNTEFKIAHLNQKHSAIVNFIKKEGIYNGDGLFTAEKGLLLVVKTADCLPVFFYEEKREVIGIIHSGWRSGLGGIFENLNVDLKFCKVLVGVGLKECCFKIGKDFLKYKKFHPFIKKKGVDFYFNPVMFSREILMRQGLKEENFFNLNMCSFCHPYKFFSYRRSKTKNRTLSFILKLSDPNRTRTKW